MKRIDILSRYAKSLFATACAAMLMAACTREDIDSQPTLPDHMSVTTTVAEEISFGVNSTNKFLVESSAPWSAEVSQGEEWCSLSGYSSDELALEAEVFITVQANLSTEPRSALIKVWSDKIEESTQEITITQMGYGAAIVLSQSDLTVLGVLGSTATFTVTSTSAWSIDENEYFSFDPAQGEGDPYMADEPVVVTATTKSSNTTSEDIVTEVTVSNSDNKEATLRLTQQKAVTLDFADLTPLVASAHGETLEVGVVTDSDAWKLYCSNSAAEIDYSKVESDGVVLVTLPKNATFAARSMTLSLKTDDGAVSSSEDINLTQETTNGEFNLISYMTGSSSASIDEQTGALTIDNVGGLKARVASSNNSIYGMGRYTFEIESYKGVSNSYFNIQAENAGPDRINVAIGPTTSTSVIRNAAGTIFQNPVVKPTLENLEAMTRMVLSLMPDADDESKMNLEVLLFEGEHTLFSYSLQMTNYYSANAEFVSNFALYFGICADSAPAALGSNTMTISSFDFEAYDPEAEPEEEEDEVVMLDFESLNYTSYLNGSYSIAGGSLTINHESAAQARFTTEGVDGMNLFGMGTYTIKFSNFEGVSNSFINLQAICSTNSAGEQFNINIGPSAAQSVLKSDQGVWAAVITLKPTLAQLESMTTLTISLLPVEANPVNMNLTVSIDGEVLSSTGGITSFLGNANYVNNMNLYFGVGGGSTGSTITIDSFSYEPYEQGVLSF
ncbi:MAG: BACON domain-containing carbohydrate-binding protein [Rikenellaceae bacterium]